MGRIEYVGVDFDRVLFRPSVDQLWGRVKIGTEQDCWPWIGSTDRDGYGRLLIQRQYKRKQFLAHRVAWWFATGEYPPEDKLVCHTCDNPPCVNFNHLWLGDTYENTADCVSKNRQTHGIRNGRAILDINKVNTIRELRKTTTLKELARKFGVTQSTIEAVIYERNWKNAALR